MDPIGPMGIFFPSATWLQLHNPQRKAPDRIPRLLRGRITLRRDEFFWAVGGGDFKKRRCRCFLSEKHIAS